MNVGLMDENEEMFDALRYYAYTPRPDGERARLIVER